MGAVFEGALKFVIEVGVAIWEGIEYAVTTIWEVVVSTASWVAEAIGGIGELALGALKAIGEALGVSFEEVADFVVELYKDWIEPIVTPIEEFVTGLIDELGAFVQALHLREILLVHEILSKIWPHYLSLIHI